jgi:uncharacterized protein
MPRIEPAFIDLAAVGPGGTPPGSRRRFAVLHQPEGPPRGLVVYAHPFGEEMNKSRRMAALQARALAGAGNAVLQVDLLGCGDSPGDFGEAGWDDWVDDLVQAARWLRRSSGAGDGPADAHLSDPHLSHPHCSDPTAASQSDPAGRPPPVVPPAPQPSAPLAPGQPTHLPLTLWGLRAGTLLAAAAAARLGDVDRLLLWQPAPSGKPLLQQFLRLAVAGELTSGAASRGGTDALRQRLQGGEPVEIAGYTLAPALAAGLEAARIEPPAGVRQVVWLECTPREAPALAPASAAPVDALRQAGCAVQAQAVQGPAFWQTTEIEEAPALLAATLSAMSEPLPPLLAQAASGADSAPAPVAA